MKAQVRQIRSQNKLLFCSLCGFMTESQEELDMHYKFSHEHADEDEDIFEVTYLSKKEYEEYMKNEYERVCKSGSCIIRRYIDLEDDKNKVKQLYKDYCLTCILHKYLFAELKKEGKI